MPPPIKRQTNWKYMKILYLYLILPCHHAWGNVLFIMMPCQEINIDTLHELSKFLIVIVPYSTQILHFQPPNVEILSITGCRAYQHLQPQKAEVLWSHSTWRYPNSRGGACPGGSQPQHLATAQFHGTGPGATATTGRLATEAELSQAAALPQKS